MRRVVLALSCLVSLQANAGFDDPARYAFLSSRAEQAVIIIDLEERSKAGEIRLTEAPDAVTVSQALRAAIVTHRDLHKLTLIDLTAAEPVQIDYPLDLRPDVVLVSPIGETVAILDRDKGELQVHALKRSKILVTVKDVHTSSALTFSPDGAWIYWVDSDAGILHAADLWSARKQLRLARESALLSAMTRSIDGTLGFVSSAGEDAVHVVDLRTFALLRTTRAGRQPARAWGTADGRYMLVPNTDSGTVTALSAATGDFLYTVRTAASPVSINPGWIDTVAAVVGHDGQIAFLSIDDGAELARADLDDVAQAGIVTSDSKTLAVPVPGKGSIAFFDMRDRSQLSTLSGLPLDIGPAALAVSNNLCH